MTTYRSTDLVHRVMHTLNPDLGPRQWCEEQFGPRWEVTGDQTGTWTVFWRGWMTRRYEWMFVNEQDMILFTLRWS